MTLLLTFDDVGTPFKPAMEAGELGEGSMPRSADIVSKARADCGKEVLSVAITHDSDIVAARQAARQVAVQAGLTETDATLVATAVSEVARNIVRFTDGGEVLLTVVQPGPRRGVAVTARDHGPGIADVHQALADGFSTCAGLGLGLPGARRIMDEFAVVSEPEGGTTVTMTKWCS
jgi:anti-sigma regulatory factor (Ser/Thr protein kinase)